MTGNRWQQKARAEGDARITQIAVAGDYVTHAPGAGPLPPAPLGLPAPPAALVGRDGAVKELTDLLEAGGPPVTVVAGLPGVGKSALAVTTAHRAVERGWFEDRVFFLQLHGYAPNGAVSGPQAVREMLRYLGITDSDVPPSADGQVALYRARLAALARAGQRVLVVADDAGSVSQVRGLVPPDGTHRLLVTSRHRLVAPGFAARVVGLDELAAEPAAQLLAEALLRTWPQDLRPAREPEALARIAGLCGRLPLALTVAGALLAGDPGLAAGELAGELAQARTRLGKLSVDGDGFGDGDGSGDGEGFGDVPVGVRAAFDLSYARLPADQARVFRLLTVVPGPDSSTLYAALVTGDGEVEDLIAAAAGLRPALAALVRASLLMEQPVGSGRWRMHDLVRLYALGRGEESAEEDGREGVIDGLLSVLLESIERAGIALGLETGPVTPASLSSVAEALDWFDAERAMLVGAVVLAADSGRTRAALDLGDQLRHYLSTYGYVQEALVVGRVVLETARRVGDPVILGIELCNLSSVLISTEVGVEEAAGHLADALRLFRDLGDRAGEGRAMSLLGGVHQREGRFVDATAILEEALVIFREQGMRHEERMTLIGLGENLRKLERLDEAMAVYEQAATIAAETGNRHGAALLLSAFGRALEQAGSREQAIATQREALDMMREVGNRAKVARTLVTLSGSLLDGGQLEEARVECEEAVALFEEIGQSVDQAAALLRLGQIHQRAGRLTQELASQERATELLAGAGEREAEAMGVMAVAMTLAKLGRLAEAAETLDRSAGLYDLVGDAELAAKARAVGADLRGLTLLQADPPGRLRDRLRPRPR